MSLTEFFVGGHLCGLLDERRQQRMIDSLTDHNSQLFAGDISFAMGTPPTLSRLEELLTPAGVPAS